MKRADEKISEIHNANEKHLFEPESLESGWIIFARRLRELIGLTLASLAVCLQFSNTLICIFIILWGPAVIVQFLCGKSSLS